MYLYLKSAKRKLHGWLLVKFATFTFLFFFFLFLESHDLHACPADARVRSCHFAGAWAHDRQFHLCALRRASTWQKASFFEQGFCFGSRRRMVENGELESVNARFKAVEESDLKALVNGASSEATKRATSYLLRVVTAYRENKNDWPIVFATCTPQECNGFLCRFYASMRPSADEPSSSSTSIRHVLLGTDFLSKNCRAGASGREFQSSGRITDQHQVAAIRQLLDKLHPAVPKLFQRVHPTVRPSNKVWFMKAPLGHNLLSSMMKCISVSAGLLRSYSNHCLRATSIVTLLQKAGFSDRMICSVSGHKNPSSQQLTTDPARMKRRQWQLRLTQCLSLRKKKARSRPHIRFLTPPRSTLC